MNLRLLGLEPLIGVDFHQSSPTFSVGPESTFETCDCCGRRSLARYTYFDGTRFLCANCGTRDVPCDLFG